MKKNLLILLSFLVVLCLSMVVVLCLFGKKSDITAEQIVTKLQVSNLPINNVIVYTEQTDVNKFLGKPNQYISKVNFADTTIQQRDATNPNGGSIETFKNSKDLNARKTYIESIFKASPAFTEYIFVNKNYMLRLNKELSNDQVNKYEEAFMSIK